jgi:hypothetical protein
MKGPAPQWRFTDRALLLALALCVLAAAYLSHVTATS